MRRTTHAPAADSSDGRWDAQAPFLLSDLGLEDADIRSSWRARHEDARVYLYWGSTGDGVEYRWLTIYQGQFARGWQRVSTCSLAEAETVSYEQVEVAMPKVLIERPRV
jgi:hypothetical protein